MPAMVDVSVASESAVWALVTWVSAEAMLAWSEAIWADEAPSAWSVDSCAWSLAKPAWAWASDADKRRVVDGGQCLPRGHRLTRRDVDGGDPTGYPEVEIGLLGRFDGAR